MKWLTIAPGKSGAREVAAMLLILWAFLVGWLHIWIPKEDVQFYKDIFGTITTAVFTFGLGAFGVASVMGKLQGAQENVPHFRKAGVSARPADSPESHRGAI